MKNTQDFIDFIQKVNDAAQAISFAAALVNKVRHDAELYNKYNTQMQDMITEYNTQITLLRNVLERYMEKEKRENIPISLPLRKAYQSLEYL
jgi:DNA-binding transcriptional MocR family regulator